MNTATLIKRNMNEGWVKRGTETVVLLKNQWLGFVQDVFRHSTKKINSTDSQSDIELASIMNLNSEF
jgi:hypothetical protein